MLKDIFLPIKTKGNTLEVDKSKFIKIFWKKCTILVGFCIQVALQRASTLFSIKNIREIKGSVWDLFLKINNLKQWILIQKRSLLSNKRVTIIHIYVTCTIKYEYAIFMFLYFNYFIYLTRSVNYQSENLSKEDFYSTLQFL